MENFAVDQGLFNGKENDKRVNKRTESKMKNQHVSELNVPINGLRNGNYGKCERNMRLFARKIVMTMLSENAWITCEFGEEK